MFVHYHNLPPAQVHERGPEDRAGRDGGPRGRHRLLGQPGARFN